MANTYTIRSVSSAETFNKLTVSCWFKGMADGTQRAIWGIYNTSSTNRFFGLYYSSNGSLYGYWKKQSSGYLFTLGTMQKFYDPNAWYNFVMSVDTTLATASDRVKFYLNGERITVFEDTLDTITQNENIDLLNDTNGKMQWGGNIISGTQYYWNGSMSHCHMCVGYAYDASAFGSTDSTTGEWKINTSPNVQYGTNGGFWFKDGNQLTDSSTNSNTLTVGGGTLTKTEDCPSNVFATWNPLAQPNGTLSNGNTSNSGAEDTPATIGITKGKWYWEYKRTNTSNSLHFGICSTKKGFNKTSLQMLNGESNSVGAAIYISEGGVGTASYGNAAGFSSTSYSGVSTPSIANGDIVGCALDISTSSGTLTFYKNGSSMGAATFTYDQETPVFPFIRMNSGASADVNFGNGYFGTTAVSSAGTNASNLGIFEYDVPSGYTALCTKGLNL